MDADRAAPDGRDPGEVRFRLLGELEVLKHGVDHAPTAPKVLQLMAMLLLRPGRVVPTNSIIEELWDDHPPRSVRSTMQTYVYHLRRCIEDKGLAPDGEAMLSTRSPGYVLRIAPEQVDVFNFHAGCRAARESLAAGRSADGAAALRAALDLWSGPPLANVACGPVLSAFAMDLREQRRAAEHLYVEARIACGDHRELVGHLRAQSAAARLDESVHAQLMRVLALSGRRSEAMATFRELRARLASELGVEPCAELQSLHGRLLAETEPRRAAG